MGAFKKLLRPRVIAWAGTSVLVAAFLVTATILTTRTFKVLLEGKFGGDIAIKKEGDSGINFEQEYFDKDEARENGNRVTKEICEEGMVLLKNKEV